MCRPLIITDKRRAFATLNVFITYQNKVLRTVCETSLNYIYMRSCIFMLLSFACVWVCMGQQASSVPGATLSERRVAYEIQARLDTETKTIHGLQYVTWRNPDKVAVTELQFHLYLNAFKDSSSTFMMESRGGHRGFTATDEDPWGGIEIKRMSVLSEEEGDVLPLGTASSAGREITGQIEYIQPDDGNTLDQTVISVLLPEAVQPGNSITLEIDFESKLPEIIARTGWKKKDNDSLFVLAGQWFPKLGVYEVPGQRYVPDDAPSGQWSTHQFHANSEFYADFGSYEVDISVPSHYVVGATGVKVAESFEGSYKTITYEAHDVHDFAWTASGDLLEFEDTWEHVTLRLLIQPEHVAQVQRHFDAAKTGFAYLKDWVGPYPYDTLTLVDGIGGSNGMEYPTFITCGTFYKLPNWLRALELVTIHELGHQYFYGVLASNEAEEAWLDEGINSYLEMRIMDEAYGEGAVVNLPWIKVADSDIQRWGYITNDPGRGAIFTKSWEYTYTSDYGKASYFKPAVVLATLEGHLGWVTMRKLLQTYYSRWQFNHPTTRDFIEVAEEISGQDLDWFFDQFVYGTEVVDYAVGDIEVSRVDNQYQNDFTVLRLQNGKMPMHIRLFFADGTHEDLSWGGEEEVQTFSLIRETAVREVYIDPLETNLLDLNRLNNRKRTAPESRFAGQQLMNSLTWFQHFLQIASSIF